jgi:hypothetical protein
MLGNGPEHGETLRRDGQVMLAKGGFRVAHRTPSMVKIWTLSKTQTIFRQIS